MSRGLQTFKQGDLAKAMKAARIAGVDVERYEIDRTGTIIVKVGTTTAAAVADQDNERASVR